MNQRDQAAISLLKVGVSVQHQPCDRAPDSHRQGDTVTPFSTRESKMRFSHDKTDTPYQKFSKNMQMKTHILGNQDQHC